MLNRLLQAITITSAIYLTMLCSPSPFQQTVLLNQQQPAELHHLEHLLANVIDFLLDPFHKDA